MFLKHTEQRAICLNGTCILNRTENSFITFKYALKCMPAIKVIIRRVLWTDSSIMLKYALSCMHTLKVIIRRVF